MYSTLGFARKSQKLLQVSFVSSHVFDREAWVKLPLFDQLGNIGSEVGRTMNAIRRDDEAALDGAFRRGLDLIDASAVALPFYRRRELLRARELFAQAFITRTPDTKLEDYFMQYAIAARANR